MRERYHKQETLENKAEWDNDKTFPPLWLVLVDEHSMLFNTNKYIRQCFGNLIRLIDWFERNRTAGDGGYYYLDMVEQR